MPVAGVPFGQGESPGLEPLTGGVPPSVNVVADATGAVTLRPGITAWEGFPEEAPISDPVVGMHRRDSERLLYVTRRPEPALSAFGFSYHRIGIVPTAGVAQELPEASVFTVDFQGTLRPRFALTRTRLCVSAGGPPVQWSDASAGYQFIPGLSTSVAAVGIVATTQRLIVAANDASGLMYWSGVGDTGHESWTLGLNFAEAEFKPDRLVGLAASAGEIVALGTETVQMFSPDPSVVFSPARSMDIGCASGDSFVPYGEEFFWLSDRQEIVRSNGRSFAAISGPDMTKTLKGYATVSDCWGYRAQFDNSDLISFTFPTAGTTLTYDAGLKRWGEWRGFADGQWANFAPTSHYFWAERNLHLVGMPDGRIMRLDPDAETDDGDPIVAELVTPFVSHGTGAWKLNVALRLRFRRGEGTSTESFAELWTRDDTGAWGEPYRISLGTEQDQEPVVEIRSMGTYRQRQYRLRIGGKRFVFAGAEEEYRILGSVKDG